LHIRFCPTAYVICIYSGFFRNFIETRLSPYQTYHSYFNSQALSHPWIHADGKMLSSYDLSESLSEMELFQNNKQFKVGVNVILAVHKLSRSRLMRSNSMGSVSGSESNTPVGSPVPAINNTTNGSSGSASGGGVERTLSVNIHAPGVNSVYSAGGPVSPKSGNSGAKSFDISIIDCSSYVRYVFVCAFNVFVCFCTAHNRQLS